MTRLPTATLMALLGALVLSPVASAQGAAPVAARVLPPSENAGRIGVYHAQTSHAQYAYWVYAPKSYSAENPAGLHLFFHGNGGQRSAKSNLGMWAPYFLEPGNLIGINMEFNDGSPHDDAENKA